MVIGRDKIDIQCGKINIQIAQKTFPMEIGRWGLSKKKQEGKTNKNKENRKFK